MAYVLDCQAVTVRRGTRRVLDQVTWQVSEGESWVVLGPNGAGKTTLMLIAATRLFPTSGQVTVLGERLGETDLADLRPLIGWASSALAEQVPPGESLRDVVLTGAHAVTGRWREDYDVVDLDRCQVLLGEWGLGRLQDRTFGTLSEGERKRTMIARSLMANPHLLLLDEPGAGLDLGGREDLVTRLSGLADDPRAPVLLVVTHHVEEIPAGFTHALVLSGGRVLASGTVSEVITSATLSTAFKMPLLVQQDEGRFTARAVR